MQAFSCFASELAAAFRDGHAVLFCILAASLTLLASVLSLKAWRRRFQDDLLPALVYFLSFFVLLFLAPMAWILARGEPSPASLGLQLGQWRLGVILVAPITVLLIIAVFFGGRKNMGDFYPFSKQAMSRLGVFIAYEAVYFLLYYTAWEFTFRGVMLFSLVSMLGGTPGGILAAIMIETTVSAVFHIGHPESEIAASFVVGIIFGVVALTTGSILYTILIHAAIGIFEDSMAYRRRAREVTT